MAKNLSLNLFYFFTRNEVGIWSDSYHSTRIHSECVGEGKVLKKSHPCSPTVEGSEDIFQKNNNNKPTSLSKKSSNSHRKGSSDDNYEIEKPQGSPEEELGI